VESVIKMKWRLVIFALVTVAVLTTLSIWPGANEPGYSYDVSVWAGPALLFSIPVTLAWVSFGAESRWAAVAGFSTTMILVASCLLLIWSLNRFCAGILTPAKCFS
jgi:hypothetical protein